MHSIGAWNGKKIWIARIATMPNVISEQNFTFAQLKHNLPDIQDNLAAPILKRWGRHIFLRNIALTGVLLAFAIGVFAQTQQVSAASTSLDQPDKQAGRVAVVETQAAAAASNNAQDQSQSAAGLSKEIGNPLSNLWLLQVQQNNTLVGMPLG